MGGKEAMFPSYDFSSNDRAMCCLIFIVFKGKCWAWPSHIAVSSPAPGRVAYGAGGGEGEEEGRGEKR
jgi:hypothetical protein